MRRMLFLFACLFLACKAGAQTGTVSVAPTTVAVNGSVTATFTSMPATALDWLGVYTTGGTQGDWVYTSSCTQTPATVKPSGSCMLPMRTAGTFQIRLFANDGYQELARSATITVGTAVTTPVLSPPVYRYPLKVGSDQRHLVDQDNVPFLGIGDSGWFIFTQPSLEDATAWINDRAAKGYRTFMAELIDNYYQDNRPANFYNESPWTGKAFATPNPAYFARTDAVLQAAAAKNMTIFVAPAWLGFQCTATTANDGWCKEVQAATVAEMQSYGTFIGNHYRNIPNIVWVIGGDTAPDAVRSRLDGMAAAILAADPTHLMTYHGARRNVSSTYWPTNPAWFTLNAIYTDGLEYSYASPARDSMPTRPFVLLEGYYENDTTHPTQSSAQGQRAQTYWTLLSGGVGQMRGNCPFYSFDAMAAFTSWCAGLGSWKTQTDTQGSKNSTYASNVLLSRNWPAFVSDDSNAVLTGGRGASGSTDFAVIVTSPQTFLLYLPTSRQVTINTTTLGATGSQVKAWWFKPSDGSTTLIGTSAKNAAAKFTPPAAGDWVLVLDDAALNLPAPGTAVYAPPSVPLPTALISAMPASVPAGSASTLTWSTTNATTTSISGLGAVSASGSQAVTPAATTTYTLTATNSTGTTTAATTVTVNASQTPPVGLLGVLDNAVVAGTVKLTAGAASNVAGMTLLVDGQPFGAEVTAPPYAWSWPTAGLTLGPHTVAVRVRGTDGTTVDSGVATVQVAAGTILSAK